MKKSFVLKVNTFIKSEEKNSSEVKVETNDFITSIKREKNVMFISSSKNITHLRVKDESIARKLRISQKQQDRDRVIDTEVEEAKKSAKQYSSHKKSRLKRERLIRMNDDEKIIMRVRNADRAARSYAIFKLKSSFEYRNMTKKKKKLREKKTLKNINARRFREEISNNVDFSQIFLTV
jgi:hypothetical protein